MEMHSKALAVAVENRRGLLGITQKQLAALAGVSVDTVQAAENARRSSYSTPIKRSLERALQWEMGSIDRCLDSGAAPVELPIVEASPEPADGVMSSPLFRELMAASVAEVGRIADEVGKEAGDPTVGQQFAISVLRLQQRMARKP